MAKPIKGIQRWVSGISDFLKEGAPDSYSHGRSIDHRSDPRSITLNPRTVKGSGTVIEDLPKWGEVVDGEVYLYGDTGKLYKRNTAGAYSKLRQVSDSHGNGMSYFGEDDFVYYTTDTTIGRYGPVTSSNPQFSDDFLGAQGGTPLNTNAMLLAAASSQYAYRADTVSLSVEGDLSLEAQIKPTTLPSGSDTQALISKWNEDGNLRSYKLEIGTVSNYFGDGSDGALTISTNTTDAPIDSACTGTIATQTLSATNALFAANQVILIHQTQGTNAGVWMKNTIQSYTAGTITTVEPLNISYTTGAQVLVLKQYTDVTVNTGITWTAKAWDGTVGGILAFLASGTVTITGTITASGKGFRGGNRGYYYGTNTTGQQGEGYLGVGTNTYSANLQPNGNGGGGAARRNFGSSTEGQGGGGGGNGTMGSNGSYYIEYQNFGYGGNTHGSADLATLSFGGGGGGGGMGDAIPTTSNGFGQPGGGAVFIASIDLIVNSTSGNILSNGIAGTSSQLDQGGGGAGAGGSILLKVQTATLNTTRVLSSGGAAGASGIAGGAGGTGRIHIDYYTSYTGTTTPTIDGSQDDNLGSTDGNKLSLHVSDDGTDTERYDMPMNIVVDIWQQVAVSWNASTSTAEFFYNGVPLGTSVGAMTAIDDNTSEFFIGTEKDGTGTAVNFYDGLIDEVKVWSTVKTASEYLLGLTSQTLTTLPYLQGYFKFNGDYADASSYANTLSGSGTPTFPTDVPFPSPSSRLDIDQTATTTGNTYTTPLTIAETATARKTFVPAKDPQKSVSVLIADIGTGDWTITVHDQYNNTVASKTVANGDLGVGYFEFIFVTPWRPLLNVNYHFHVTSTVADGTVTSTNLNDLETVSFRTYYQFLVTDTQWHPVAKMLQFLVFGNERYVGTYEATLYDPNYITLPAGYRVRCFGYFREYLAIGTVRGEDISAQDAGRIYFWDGIATTYNFYLDVPEGGINALLGTKGKLYVWAGYQGDLLEYTGGESAEQIKRVPKIESDKYLEVYPQAVCMWKMLTRFGVCGDSDSDVLQRGVYTWGSQNNRYPDSLSFDYPVSTGNYGNTIKIGLTMVIDRNLLIGYQDNVSYGIDYVDAGNDPYLTGTVEQMLEDDGVVWKEKEVMQIVANFMPLLDGESINVKYKLDRDSAWTSLGAVTEAGATVARFAVATGGQRYKEIQYAADLATTTTTSPTLLGLTIERDYKESETRVG